MTMLVSLDDMKANLGITDTSSDAFLTEQINIVSEAIELYCSRKFLSSSYVQTIYRDEIPKDTVKEIYLYHYPIISIASIVDQDGDTVADYRVVNQTGLLRKRTRFFDSVNSYSSVNDNFITVTYTAGYSELPYTIKSVVYTLVGERYTKKSSGVDLNFGIDVQRVSIPGTISIDYDYSLQNNDSSTALGSILGNQTNILDQFRSERKVLGTLREGYVY